MTDKVSADLAGPAQTMLTTLYCKALDADLPEPILGDAFAKDTVARIDFDWASVKVTPRWTPLVTVRTALFDMWVSQFLAVHPRASVIHLGCGLDSRILRLAPGPDVEWFDVDYPPVIALKEQLFPKRQGYHLKAVTNDDWSWLGEIPHDRPVLLLVEGVSMYLTEAEGIAMIDDVVARFPAGEIQHRLLQRGHRPFPEGAPPAAPVRVDAALGRRPAGRRPRPRARAPAARRHELLRRLHLRPDVAGLPRGPCARSPNPAGTHRIPIPSVRFRAGQLTERAACARAVTRSTSWMRSSVFSGDGPCEWNSMLSFPAKICVK